jgi:hypothetical protein
MEVRYIPLATLAREAKQAARVQDFRTLCKTLLGYSEREVPSYDASLHRELRTLRDAVTALQGLQRQRQQARTAQRARGATPQPDPLSAMADQVYAFRRQCCAGASAQPTPQGLQPQERSAPTPPRTGTARQQQEQRTASHDPFTAMADAVYAFRQACYQRYRESQE